MRIGTMCEKFEEKRNHQYLHILQCLSMDIVAEPLLEANASAVHQRHHLGVRLDHTVGLHSS